MKMQTTVDIVNPPHGDVMIRVSDDGIRWRHDIYSAEEALLLARQIQDALQGAEEDANDEDQPA